MKLEAVTLREISQTLKAKYHISPNTWNLYIHIFPNIWNLHTHIFPNIWNLYTHKKENMHAEGRLLLDKGKEQGKERGRI